MTIDYDKIVEDFDISKLTKKKVTVSFIRKNFKEEITDLRLVLSVGNGNLEDNTKKVSPEISYSASSEPEVINQHALPMNAIFMGQEMTTDIWLGFVRGLLKGEFIRTVNHNGQITLVTYDKKLPIPESIKVSKEVGDIPEKEIVSGLKKALIKRF